MEDKLRLNTKLYGFSGIIGRRDYFLNIILIIAISLFFTIPYTIWLYSNIQTYWDLFDLSKMFSQTPFLLKWWIISGIPLTFLLFASNVYRRLNDINGKINKYLNGFIIFLLLLNNLWFILPSKIYFLLHFICIIFGFIILFKHGKITVNYPYDFTKEFNWGAFFGTWIWGLFNKSYKTLWTLLIQFTPWSLYFSIYCGLKGNEWAFKNKKWNDVAAFNKSQEKQCVIFLIIFLLVIPAFVILSVFMFSAFISAGNTINHPMPSEQTVNKIDNSMNKISSIYFKKQVITEDENKFYVSSNNWERYSYKTKKDVFDMAVSLAEIERLKGYDKQNPESYKILSKEQERLRTKIYSFETNHILGEYILDLNNLKNGSFKDILKASLSAYNFYNDKTSNEYIKNVNELKKVQTEYIKNTENTKQAPYFDLYMKELQKEIKKNWTPPKDNESNCVVVLFSIMKDGTLLNIKIKNSSGIYEVDEEAVKAVKLAFPYKALPSEYKGDRVDVDFTFDNKVLNE